MGLLDGGAGSSTYPGPGSQGRPQPLTTCQQVLGRNFVSQAVVGRVDLPAEGTQQSLGIVPVVKTGCYRHFVSQGQAVTTEGSPGAEEPWRAGQWCRAGASLGAAEASTRPLVRLCPVESIWQAAETGPPATGVN